jgi:YD repeat-containing protein
VSVAQPGNSGATTYVYEGNAVTVTDPAGKWKKYSTDALGDLVQVTEPDPALGNVQANYTYNLRNQLTQVSMPRGAATQTRTFNFDLTTGRLTSATNPENGTVSYVYNTDGSVASRTDAKGQRNEYTYDSFGRVTRKRGYQCSGCSVSSTVDFVYDSSMNAWGRLTSFTSNGPSGSVSQWFIYTPAGLVTNKSQSGLGSVLYSYDSEGRTVSTQYPFGGPTFTYTYDQMGRPIGLRDNQETPVDWVKDVAYNAAGQIT